MFTSDDGTQVDQFTEGVTDSTTEEVIQYEGSMIASNALLGVGIGGAGILASILIINVLKIFNKGV